MSAKVPPPPQHDLFIWKDRGLSPAGGTSQRPWEVKVASKFEAAIVCYGGASAAPLSSPTETTESCCEETDHLDGEAGADFK